MEELNFDLNGKIHALKLKRVIEKFYEVTIHDKNYFVNLLKISENHISLLIDNKVINASFNLIDNKLDLTIKDQKYFLNLIDETYSTKSTKITHEDLKNIIATMPGKIVKILVNENQKIISGQGLIVIEAMKMENEIRSPRDGEIEKLLVKEGEGIEAGTVMIRIK